MIAKQSNSKYCNYVLKTYSIEGYIIMQLSFPYLLTLCIYQDHILKDLILLHKMLQ